MVVLMGRSGVSRAGSWGWGRRGCIAMVRAGLGGGVFVLGVFSYYASMEREVWDGVRLLWSVQLLWFYFLFYFRFYYGGQGTGGG